MMFGKTFNPDEYPRSGVYVFIIALQANTKRISDPCNIADHCACLHFAAPERAIRQNTARYGANVMKIAPPQCRRRGAQMRFEFVREEEDE